MKFRKGKIQHRNGDVYEIIIVNETNKILIVEFTNVGGQLDHTYYKFDQAEVFFERCEWVYLKKEKKTMARIVDKGSHYATEYYEVEV